MLSAGLDIGHLTRQFLPASELTVHSYGLQLRHRRYWHPLLAPRIGQKITVHRDERTLQEVYADLDGAFLSVPVVGRYPHVTEPEWEAARRRQREEGAAYQADGARAATARYIQAARQEALTARQRTRSTRQERKRQEREGVSHAESARPAADTAAANWIPAAQLPDDGWLQWRD